MMRDGHSRPEKKEKVKVKMVESVGEVEFKVFEMRFYLCGSYTVICNVQRN